MKTKKFTLEENRILTEIYRRLNYFHGGDVTRPMVLLDFPYSAKSIVKLGLIKTYSNQEHARCLNWYNLTEKGQEFFKNYIEKVDTTKNVDLFDGVIKTFDKNLLPCVP
jgi:hypothetical protein